MDGTRWTTTPGRGRAISTMTQPDPGGAVKPSFEGARPKARRREMRQAYVRRREHIAASPDLTPSGRKDACAYRAGSARPVTG
jgi:hypothetical protein